LSLRKGTVCFAAGSGGKNWWLWLLRPQAQAPAGFSAHRHGTYLGSTGRTGWDRPNKVKKRLLWGSHRHGKRLVFTGTGTGWLSAFPQAQEQVGLWAFPQARG
jgi:hypothetical protein